MGKVKLFFKSMFSEWGSGLSGPPSIPLAILALYTSVPALRIAYGTGAVILGFFSAYRVWRGEYDRAERELARHTRPQIVPEVLACFWDVSKLEGTNVLQTYIYAFIGLVNLTDVDTLIKQYELEVSWQGNEGDSVAGVNDSAFLGGKIRYPGQPVIPGSRHEDGVTLTPISTISSSINQQTPLKKGLHVTGGIAIPINLTHMGAYETFSASMILKVTDSFDGIHSSDLVSGFVRYGEFTPTRRQHP
jgi:hypothetical protein